MEMPELAEYLSHLSEEYKTCSEVPTDVASPERAVCFLNAMHAVIQRMQYDHPSLSDELLLPILATMDEVEGVTLHGHSPDILRSANLGKGRPVDPRWKLVKASCIGAVKLLMFHENLDQQSAIEELLRVISGAPDAGALRGTTIEEWCQQEKQPNFLLERKVAFLVGMRGTAQINAGRTNCETYIRRIFGYDRFEAYGGEDIRNCIMQPHTEMAVLKNCLRQAGKPKSAVTKALDTLKQVPQPIDKLIMTELVGLLRAD